jgi:hypothetical protein
MISFGEGIVKFKIHLVYGLTYKRILRNQLKINKTTTATTTI